MPIEKKLPEDGGYNPNKEIKIAMITSKDYPWEADEEDVLDSIMDKYTAPDSTKWYEPTCEDEECDDKVDFIMKKYKKIPQDEIEC